VATLVAIVLVFVGMNVLTPYNCQVWISFALFSAYLAFATASLLILFRIIAIWNRNIAVVAIAFVVWATNVAFMARGVVRVRAEWSAFEQNCVVVNPESSKLNMTTTLANDIVLLLIMLVGLLRLRYHGGGRFRLGSLLWKQGLLWLLLATAAEVPPNVLIFLDLNEPLNFMFQLPSLITISIAATRMYRSLVDFASGTTDIMSDNLQNSSSNGSKAKSSTLRFNPIEVTMDKSYEHHPMSHASHYTSVGTDKQLGDKSQVLCPENDLESATETRVPGGLEEP